MHPSRGPLTGHSVIELSGSGFSTETRCRILTRVVPTTTVGTDRLKCSTPPSPTDGFVSIEVVHTNQSESTAAGLLFLYVDSVVDSVRPTSGPGNGGTIITIRGPAFVPPSSCFSGGVRAVLATSVSTTHILCQMPVRLRRGVAVVQIESFSALLMGQVFFSYEESFRLQMVQPSSGPHAGGTTLTIIGSGELHVD